MKTNYIIPVFIPGLGCPHRCVYCNQHKITGQQRQPEARDVQRITEKYLTTIPRSSAVHKEIAFYGGSFTVLPWERQRELLQPALFFKKKGLIDAIRISTRPDYIDAGILARLKAYGVAVIELGVQSLDQQVLEQCGREYRAEDVFKAARLIKEAGFKLGLQMMLGLPQDSRAKDVATARHMLAMQPDCVRIYPTLVVDNTELAEMYARGEYRALTLEEAVPLAAWLLALFRQHAIEVIRIGLQPTEEINAVGVLAGPFHPAFRELTEAFLARQLLEQLLSAVEKEGCKQGWGSPQNLQLQISERDHSIVRGQKNSNLYYLQQRWPALELKFCGRPELQRGEMVLTAYNRQKTEKKYTVAALNLTDWLSKLR